MRRLLQILGVVLIAFGSVSGLIQLSGLKDYNHIRTMFELSYNIADSIEYGIQYAAMETKLVLGISSILFGVVLGLILLAFSKMLQNQEKILKLLTQKDKHKSVNAKKRIRFMQRYGGYQIRRP